jgi:CheY-like chemotaxis protein
MDMRLPGIDGWQATQLLKTSPKTDMIPILALTAQSLTAVTAGLTDIAYDGYVAKPINFNNLFGQIDTLTNGRPPKQISA